MNTVTMMIRAKLPDGTYPYLPAVVSPNGKIKQGMALVNGVETKVEGTYYLRYTENGKRCLVSVGENAAEARAAAERKDRELKLAREAKALGIAVPTINPTQATAARGDRTNLADAAQKYFADLEARGLDKKKTIAGYKNAVYPFIENCGRTYVDECDKDAMIAYIGWLRKQPVPKRKHGNPARTWANKVLAVAIFLKAFGVEKILKRSEYPQYAEKTVSAHTDEELEYLYSRANGKQRFILDFGLASGFRDGELAHAEWADLVGNTLEVKVKVHLGWHPKKFHCRKVTVPQAFADAWRARAKRQGGTLVFPNRNGKPDQHLLQKLQRINPPFHTELHKLRKTYATRLAVQGLPLHILQRQLGHKDVATTMRYIADVDISKGVLNQTIEAAAYVPMPKAAAA